MTLLHHCSAGERFVQVFPPGGATLEVESVLDEDTVAVVRPNGARQVFNVSTLLDTRYWIRAASDEEEQSRG